MFGSVPSRKGGSASGWRCCWSAPSPPQLPPATSQNPPSFIASLLLISFQKDLFHKCGEWFSLPTCFRTFFFIHNFFLLVTIVIIILLEASWFSMVSPYFWGKAVQHNYKYRFLSVIRPNQCREPGSSFDDQIILTLTVLSQVKVETRCSHW